jgi:hypothetical protein
MTKFLGRVARDMGIFEILPPFGRQNDDLPLADGLLLAYG